MYTMAMYARHHNNDNTKQSVRDLTEAVEDGNCARIRDVELMTET